MTLNVNLVPVDEIPTRKALGNSRAAEYDRIVAQLKAYPGQSFRLVEKTGTQSNVNALKARGVHAVLRNTDATKKGDLYAVYTPETEQAPTPAEAAAPAAAPQVDDDGMPIQ